MKLLFVRIFILSLTIFTSFSTISQVDKDQSHSASKKANAMGKEKQATPSKQRETKYKKATKHQPEKDKKKRQKDTDN